MTIDTDDLRPWVPAGAWVPRVGERVIIRLSGECPLPLRRALPGGWVEHYPNQDGMIGTVRCLADWYNADPGHPYVVSFDEHTTNNGVGQAAGTFAACELERLEETSQ